MTATLQTSALSLQIPADLAELDGRFALARLERVGGRPAKVPYSALTGRRASTIDLSAWASLDAVMAFWRRWPRAYNWLAFLFVDGDRLVGVDCDDCLTEDGRVKDWARGIVERFADTYIEVSPSGRGLKMWARGELPANLPGVPVGDGTIEIYSRKRYFAMTGQAFRGAPLQVEDHAADLLALFQHLAGAQKGNWPLQPQQNGRIPYGQQHSTLISLAGTLRARRVCEPAILACLSEVNARQCERPGTPQAIERIVTSTRRWSV
jgi:primase-polymerase (primpol)-like protein